VFCIIIIIIIIIISGSNQIRRDFKTSSQPSRANESVSICSIVTSVYGHRCTWGLFLLICAADVPDDRFSNDYYLSVSALVEDCEVVVPEPEGHAASAVLGVHMECKAEAAGCAEGQNLLFYTRWRQVLWIAW
jgi:hypothetical protein